MTQNSNSSGSSGGNAGGAKVTASNTREAQINVQELADRVYRLFLADVETQKKRLYGTRR